MSATTLEIEKARDHVKRAEQAIEAVVIAELARLREETGLMVRDVYVRIVEHEVLGSPSEYMYASVKLNLVA